MKILVLIMGAVKQPATRNMETIRNSYIKLYNENKFNNEFEFLFYIGNSEKTYQENDILYCNAPDDIEHTFDKTIAAFNYISKNKDFDFLIRTNISTYINIPLLDVVVNNLNNDNIYANQFNAYLTSIKYINDVYPRGDAYIISKNKLSEILNLYDKINFEEVKNVLDNCDDTLIGLLYLKSYKDLYINHYIQLQYNFLPFFANDLSTDNYLDSCNVIFTRLKTCSPDASISGYSWDDNEYRLEDVKKFNNINNIIKHNIHLYKDLDNINVLEIITRPQHRDIPIIDLKGQKYVFTEWNDLKNIVIKKHSDEII